MSPVDVWPPSLPLPTLLATVFAFVLLVFYRLVIDVASLHHVHPAQHSDVHHASAADIPRIFKVKMLKPWKVLYLFRCLIINACITHVLLHICTHQ